MLFMVLATTYSLVTPIFESPDELWHYPYVWHLARTGQLPIQDPTNPQLWGQEGSQPPLYYALAALLTAPVPTDDLPDLIYHNPHADIGLVSADGNANIVVHTSREAWPWRGAVLAIHLARFLSILLSTGTVLAVYAVGRILWPEQPAFALLAMSFVAFNPMFLFISGSVNNDNLITLLASLTLGWLVWLIVTYADPARPPAVPSFWHFAGLGGLVGLAALTKASGLGLAGLVGLTLLGWGWRRRSWRITVLGNVLVDLLAVAIAGWWYWRNFILYEDWTGTQNMIVMMGARPVPPTIGQLLAEAPGLLRSFWGLFGYFSVPLPAPLYWLFNLFLAAGFSGLFVPFKKSSPPGLKHAWPILLGWLVLLLIGLIQWTLRTPATQGRLLFPGLAALATLWAAGWMAIAPGRLYPLPVLIMLAVAVWTPGGVIAPAYARPAVVTSVPDAADPLGVSFGQAVELLAYQQEVSPVQPGETLPITLYWRAQKPVEADYTVFIHLLDQNDLVIAQRDLFPGPGVYPTSQWTVGESFADTYVLHLPRTTLAPAEARFEVGLYDHRTGQRLLTSTGGDNIRFGKVEIHPRPGEWPNPQTLQFEDGISLVGYTLDRQLVAAGESATLTLYWQSNRDLARNYKVFVHLEGENAPRAAQHDSEPQNGMAPTSNWTPGQVVTDPHSLTLAADAPAGAYRLVVGLYEGDTGRRLRLLRNGSDPVQADSVTLTGIRIRSR